MIAKRDFLFRYVPHTMRNQLLLDEEALYSTTDQVTADKITQDILKFVPASSTITDATACIGGSAHSFAQMFSNVYAIELDQSRFSFLKHNMFTLRNTNVVCIHGDALTKCAHIKQDVIFIDPPWGGPEYKNHASVSLYLSQQNLCDVCNNLAQYTKYIVVKVPTNFDEAAFLASTSMHMKMVYKNLSLRKMHLMIMRVQQAHPL